MTDNERHILAAQGYVELSLYPEARLQLAALPAEAFLRVDVIELSMLCLMGERYWQEALVLSSKLRELEPYEPGGYIHAAYCLHELGRTAEALQVLAQGPSALRTKPVYYYNLGCYMAKLGQVDEALELLAQSFEMDGSLRHHARKDPDLSALRDRIGV